MLATLHLNDLLEETRRTAVLAERKRIARDLHDTLAQGFTGVIIQLDAAEDAILAADSNAAATHVLRAAGLARESLREMRRCVHGLRPHVLEEGSFCQALEKTIRSATEGTVLRTKFQLRGAVRELPPLWQDHLLRIVQEALSNTLKHARATRFQVRLIFTSGSVRLEIRDDGRGFDETAAHDGIGLLGARERTEQMMGTLAVTSSRHGGTRILVTVPSNRLVECSGAQFPQLRAISKVAEIPATYRVRKIPSPALCLRRTAANIVEA